MVDCEANGSKEKEKEKRAHEKEKGKNNKVQVVNGKGVNDEEKGYEALIKPIQDVIAKDWKLKLCKYLDIYIEHIHEPGTVFVNFTEAALLLQNTSTYYCKRVDLMYNWVREFCFSLTEKFLEATTEEGEASQSGKPSEPKAKKKGKKNKNLLHSDELELLPLAHTGSKTINFKLEKIDGAEIKSVLLNTSMRTQTKPATCIPVQQSAAEEMGYKDEFRLHWKIVRSGLLLEDFRYNTNQDAEDEKVSDPPSIDDAPAVESDLDDSGDMGMDADFDDRMDFDAVPPPNPDLGNSASLPADVVPELRTSQELPLIGDQPVEEIEEPVNKPPNKNEEKFDTIIPFASLIIHRKFRRRQVFKLPKELIDDVEEIRKKQKKVKKTEEEIAKMKETDYNYHLSFSEILGGKQEDMIQHKLGKRKAACFAKRRRRTQKQYTDNNNFENVADMNNDTMEDDDRDIDDLVNDLEDLPPSTPGVGLASSGEENNSFDNNYEASARIIGQIFKSKNDTLSITKRVTAWHEMIKPVLEQAEGRSMFSVNEYGTRILDRFNEVGEVRPFSEVVKGQPKEEICRYFLSTLMLANTYNIEIQKTSDEELAKDCVEMKLLSKVRHHEELDANVGATTANGPLL